MQASQFKLAVVIVNYNTADLVEQCLNSLLGQIQQLNATVVVVDNCSPDGSAATLATWIKANDQHGHVQLVRSATNAGFASGNNLGIRSVDAECYLLLNSDTIVRPDAIKLLLDAADRHPRAGIISPRLEWSDGTPQESCFRDLSPVSQLITAAQTGPVTVVLKRFDIPWPVSDYIVKPHWTSFACVLVRRRLFEEVGLLDEGFFMYFEDVEFCRRTRKAGWEIVHDANPRVVHLRGKSSPVKQRSLERKRLPRYYYASRTRYLYLGYGYLGLTIANILWSIGRCVSKSREIVERRSPGLPDRQWIDIWTNWLDPSAPWIALQNG